MKKNRDRDWKEFVAHVKKTLVPQIKDTNVFLAMAPPDDKDIDIKMAVEIGLCILLDKPLIVIAPEGRHMHERLLRIADHVIIADVTTEEGRESIGEKLRVVLNQ